MRNPYGDFSHLTYTTYHAKEEQTMTEKLKKIISRLCNYTTSELCDGAVDYHTMDYHIRRQVLTKISSDRHLLLIRQKESVVLFRMQSYRQKKVMFW